MTHKDHNVYSFDYEFDLDTLRSQFYDGDLIDYSDERGSLSNFKISRTDHFDYSLYLCDLFKINARPRFFRLEANTVLPMHKDLGTLCSINIMLNDSEPAPVSFEDGEYLYKSAILNVQNTHGVVCNSENRDLFKLSIFDEDFESVCEKVRRVVEK